MYTFTDITLTNKNCTKHLLTIGEIARVAAHLSTHTKTPTVPMTVSGFFPLILFLALRHYQYNATFVNM